MAQAFGNFVAVIIALDWVNIFLLTGMIYVGGFTITAFLFYLRLRAIRETIIVSDFLIINAFWPFVWIGLLIEGTKSFLNKEIGRR